MDTPINIPYDEPKATPDAVTWNIEDILGSFKQVTSIPTWNPKTLRDSLALDTTTGKIYYYDTTNKLWRTAGGGAASYGGFVNSTSNANVLPAGWSCVVNGSNVYTLTHNLGSLNYGFVPMMYSISLNPNLITKGVNSFIVEFDNSSGTAFATNWEFVLVPTV